MKTISRILWMGLICGSVYAGEYPPVILSPAAHDYWYNQGAEISKFDLKQARYGEIHEGQAVLVFVTEPFNAVTQVKSDNAEAPDAVPVLKLNGMRKFHTGLYPYSTMTSVFTPISKGPAIPPLKITTSVQEWCGHIWAQLNQTDAGYRVRTFSYFETEGDRDIKVDGVISEDALWNMIRLDPAQLPRDAFKLLPSTLFTRLKHTPFKVVQAQGTLGKSEQSGPHALLKYTVSMPELARTVEIHFGEAFPHRIEFWKETSAGGGGAKQQGLETTATRTHTIFSPYWRKNKNADAALRKQLGLR